MHIIPYMTGLLLEDIIAIFDSLRFISSKVEAEMHRKLVLYMQAF